MTMKVEEVNDASSQKTELTATEALLAEVKKLADKNKEFEEELKRLKTQQPAAFKDNDQAAMIAAAIAAGIKESRKEKNYEQGIEEEQIPIDDFDQEGVRFYSPTAGYILSDDKRKGQIVKMPYNRQAFFEHLATRRQGSGKHETTAPISVFVSHSYKEQKWIREHSLYGMMFYESAKGISHDDAKQAARVAQIMTVVKAYETPELVRHCNSFNVPLSDSYETMRQGLVRAMAQKEIEMMAAAAQQSLDATYKANVLLGRA